jgi:hypothetical protein
MHKGVNPDVARADYSSRMLGTSGLADIAFSPIQKSDDACLPVWPALIALGESGFQNFRISPIQNPGPLMFP